VSINVKEPDDWTKNEKEIHAGLCNFLNDEHMGKSSMNKSVKVERIEKEILV
jgi:hypothetical protein